MHVAPTMAGFMLGGASVMSMKAETRTRRRLASAI
jgi:hypothetical protein